MLQNILQSVEKLENMCIIEKIGYLQYSMG